MKSDKSWQLNAFCLGTVLVAQAIANASPNGNGGALFIASLIALAGTATTCWLAAENVGDQRVLAPITGVLLFAELAGFRGTVGALRVIVTLLVIAAPLGVSVLSHVLSTPRPRTVMVLGPIVGLIGAGLSLLAIQHRVPGFNLFVAIDDLSTFNPMHIDFFGQADESGAASGIGFGTLAFIVQTTVVAAWDALILSVGVFCVSLAALPFRTERT
jgi:hypothetical protein